MTLDDIKAAVESGSNVYWKSKLYSVVKDKLGQWLIGNPGKGTYIGLTWADGTTLNGKEEDFFIG